jgi:hypothetical protein
MRADVHQTASLYRRAGFQVTWSALLGRNLEVIEYRPGVARSGRLD